MKKILIAAAVTMAATTASFGAVKGNKIGLDFSMSSTLATLTTPNINNGSGSTSSVGVWWHVTDMIALRPSIAYSSTTTTVQNTVTNTNLSTTTNTFGVGLSVPIYLAKMNLLDLYVAPGVSYGSNGSNFTNLGISASLGLQVAVNDQLHFFGEMGLGYNSNTDKSTANQTTTTSSFGTARGAVGVIFYFN
ncbi:MAG: outer membrane beta-barrel protein [Spirochaetes bacterium]|nr:outer membrane beta-barrel protein [Spirochaetota bacterium]